VWAAAIVAVMVVGGLVIYSGVTAGPKTYATIDGVDCQSGEMLAYHIHAALEIMVDGQQVTVPKNTGIRSNCLFWLHTHDDSGLIHIEASAQRDFTLGQFFAIWGESLSSTQLLDKTSDATHEITATVDGQPFTGDPASIVFKNAETIVLQYGPPFGAPPKSIFQQ
jgi:hypothetical protein